VNKLRGVQKEAATERETKYINKNKKIRKKPVKLFRR
jgi:hypothetical protein